MHESRTHGRTDKLTGQSRIGSLSAPPSTTFAPARPSARASALRLRRRDRRRSRRARSLVFLSFQLPPLQLSLFPAPERETSTCAHVCEREERNHLIRDERRRAGPQASALTTRLRQSTFGEQLNEDDTRHPQDTGVGGHSCCHPTYFGAPP